MAKNVLRLMKIALVSGVFAIMALSISAIQNPVLAGCFGPTSVPRDATPSETVPIPTNTPSPVTAPDATATLVGGPLILASVVAWVVLQRFRIANSE